MLQRTLWQCVMMPDDNFALFECRACVHAVSDSALVIDIDDREEL